MGNVDVVADIEKLIQAMDGDLLVTVDDGYKSTFNIIPLIEKYNLKCMVFVTTGFVDGSAYPYEVLLGRFLQQRDYALDLDGVRRETVTAAQKAACFRQLHERMKGQRRSHRLMSLRQLATSNGVDFLSLREDDFLSWEDVLELDCHPLVEIGSHSHTHPFLPGQGRLNILAELVISKRMLENRLKRRVTKLAYPYGGSNRFTRFASRMLGYSEAYGTHCSADADDAMNLARRSLPELNGS